MKPIPMFYQFRRTRPIHEKVEEIMKARAFFTYTEMFRRLVEEEYKRICPQDGQPT